MDEANVVPDFVISSCPLTMFLHCIDSVFISSKLALNTFWLYCACFVTYLLLLTCTFCLFFSSSSFLNLSLSGHAHFSLNKFGSVSITLWYKWFARDKIWLCFPKSSTNIITMYYVKMLYVWSHRSYLTFQVDHKIYLSITHTHTQCKNTPLIVLVSNKLPVL